MRHIITSAVFAGLLSGLLWGGLVVYFVSPLILQAETYESGSSSTIHEHEGSHSHQHAEAAGSTSSFRRNLFTLLGTTSLGLSFGILSCLALLLLVRLDAIRLDGSHLSFVRGLGFGLVGFVIFQAIPSLGLPPPPPGIVGAAEDFSSRQSWWLITITLSALGALSFVTLPSVLTNKLGWSAISAKGAATVLALLIIALAFIRGIPPHSTVSNVPPSLQTRFLWTSLSVSGVFWLTLGMSLFFFLKRGYVNERHYRTTS